MKELSRVEKEKYLAVYINGNRITKTADAYFRLRKCVIVSPHRQLRSRVESVQRREMQAWRSIMQTTINNPNVTSFCYEIIST